jgi:hypothetical protein
MSTFDSPIYKLSAELLLNIFELAVEPRQPVAADSVSFVTTIASVCSYWRTLALDSPQLWAWIVNVSSIPQLECFVERSRERSLRVCYHIPPIESSDSVDDAQLRVYATLQRVGDLFPRIAQISVFCSAKVLRDALLKSCAAAGPGKLLEHLSIGVMNHKQSLEIHTAQPLDLPSLTSLSFERSHATCFPHPFESCG